MAIIQYQDGDESEYEKAGTGKLYAGADETVLGHLIVERGWSVREALEALSPEIKSAWEETKQAKEWCNTLGWGAIGLGVAAGTMAGLGFGLLPGVAAVGALYFGKLSDDEQPKRDAEYKLIRRIRLLPNVLFALSEKGVDSLILLGAYDELITALMSRASKGTDYDENDVSTFLQSRIEAAYKLQSDLEIQGDEPELLEASASDVDPDEIAGWLFQQLSPNQQARISGLADKQPVAELIQDMAQALDMMPDDIDAQFGQGAAAAIVNPKPKPKLKSAAVQQPAQQVMPAVLASTLTIEMDLVSWLDNSPEFCHLLLAGETGTGKTTFAISLLRLFLARNPGIGADEMLIIDPKYSQWAGLFRTGIYQSAFSGKRDDLSASVDRLEAFFYKIERRAIERQRTGQRASGSCLVIIDEVNTYLDGLRSMDNLLSAQNKGAKPQHREEPLNLYQRACIAISGLGRMGREDRVCLWLLGQNPNLKALGFEGASDRANFSVVSVGFRSNQVALAVALSNPSMFPLGQKLVGELEAHESANYQLAACSRLPKNLLIMPATYVQTGSGDLEPQVLARFQGSTVPKMATPSAVVEPSPWDTATTVTDVRSDTEVLSSMDAGEAEYRPTKQMISDVMRPASTVTKRPSTVSGVMQQQMAETKFHPTNWVLARIRENPEGLRFSELWLDAAKTPIAKDMDRDRFQGWMSALINKGTLEVKNGLLFVYEEDWRNQ